MPERDIDIALKQAQGYYSATPVILLGSGASAAFNMAGMWQLGQHLISSIKITDLAEEEIQPWNQFCADLNSNIDLETALTRNRLNSELTQRIIISTWDLLNPQDCQIFKNSISNQNLFPLGKLLRHLLRSTIKKIEIITTNYDRLAEYACEQESIYYYTGFSQGYRGFEESPDVIQTARRVNVWKVHGSLGWFKNEAGINISLGNTNDLPENLTPLIVTPGLDKYERASREPYRTIISWADRALMNSSSYLCIGYGFNDVHIQEKLINKCTRDNSKLIIITRSLTPAASNFLNTHDVKNYIAFTRGQDDNETIIQSSELQSPITIARDYWSLAGFSQIIM
jgi:SIR2-like domain